MSRPPRTKQPREGAINLIDLNIQTLQRAHYVTYTEPEENYWHYFSVGPMNWFREQGTEFCLVITGSPNHKNDFYALPWSVVQECYSQNRIETINERRRWVGRIRNHILTVTGKTVEGSKNDAEFDASTYFGRLDLLGLPF